MSGFNDVFLLHYSFEKSSILNFLSWKLKQVTLSNIVHKHCFILRRKKNQSYDTARGIQVFLVFLYLLKERKNVFKPITLEVLLSNFCVGW